MAAGLHGSARTTPRVRAELQTAQALSRALAVQYGLNPKTVAKWRRRSNTANAPIGAKSRSTTLTEAEEVIVVEFRKRTLLPLDDVLGCLRESIPKLTRSALHRCLVRHGISRLPKSEDTSSKRRKFSETEIGYVHVDNCQLRSAEGILHMFLAIDRVSKFAYVELHAIAEMATGAAFMRGVVKAFPYRIRKVLTDNGVAFTKNASTRWDTMQHPFGFCQPSRQRCWPARDGLGTGNALSYVPKSQQSMVSAALCQVMMRVGIAAFTLLGLAGAAGSALAEPIIVDVVGRLSQAEYQAYIAGRSYKDWGNEPFVAVNPLDPQQLVMSSFAYSTSGGDRASLWTSGDGGANWNIRFPVTAPAPGVVVPADWNFAYDDRGVLHGAALGRDGNIYQGATPNPNADGLSGRVASQWQWTPGRINLASDSAGTSDQPWIAVSGSRIHVGYDSFDAAFGRVQERVATSTDRGASFTTDTPISAGGKAPTSTNPGLRITTDALGGLYTLYGIGGPQDAANDRLVSYRLNRSLDGGQTWDFTDASLPPGGVVVATGLSAQLTNSFGEVNELRGNITAVAAAPDGKRVYAAVGFKDASGVDRIYLVTFMRDPADPGRLVSDGDPVPVSVPDQRAGLPALTVTRSGVIGLLYDSYDGRRFHVHLAVSLDEVDSFADRDLYDFTSPSAAELGLSDVRLRTLGDYQYLTSLGDTLYGAFAGRGNTLGVGVNTTGNIDPFFLTEIVNVMEPSSLTVLGVTLAGLGLVRQRTTRIQTGIGLPTRGQAPDERSMKRCQVGVNGSD